MYIVLLHKKILLFEKKVCNRRENEQVAFLHLCY